MAETIKDGDDWQARIEKTANEPLLVSDIKRARESGRGRDADLPTEIPPAGWRDVSLRLLLSVPQNRLMTLSGGVAFFVLLAIFPAIATLVSPYGIVADARTIVEHLKSARWHPAALTFSS